MQTALRFLNRYAGLQAIQATLKKCTNEYAEAIVFGVLILANIWILLYPVMYW